MRDSAFIPYKSWGKTAHIHSGLNHSSGLRPPGQASSRHLDNQHYRQRLTTEVTQRSGQTYLVYQALALLRGKSRWAASQYLGVRSPLNFVSHITPPPLGETCRGVTAFVYYYSLYLLLLLLVTSPRIYLYYCSSEYQLLSSHHPSSIRTKFSWLVASLSTLSWHQPWPDPLRVITYATPVVLEP